MLELLLHILAVCLLHVGVYWLVNRESLNCFIALIVVKLNLPQNRLHVHSLGYVRAVVNLMLGLLSVNCAETLRILVTASRVVYDIYLIFYNNLCFLTGLIAIGVVALVKAGITSVLLVFSLNGLRVAGLLLVYKGDVVRP